jgi:hypothetical protein
MGLSCTACVSTNTKNQSDHKTLDLSPPGNQEYSSSSDAKISFLGVAKPKRLRKSNSFKEIKSYSQSNTKKILFISKNQYQETKQNIVDNSGSMRGCDLKVSGGTYNG